MAQSIVGPVSNVNLVPISVFSDEWVRLYGQSFTNDLATVNTTSTTTFGNQFLSDFSCQTSLSITTGSGVISGISQNIIQVKIPAGSVVSLQVGACTNIWLLNLSVPKIGSNIFWRGIKIVGFSSTYQVYNAVVY